MINKGNIRKGKVIWARYSLTPHVVFSESNAGGIAGALGALIPIPLASAVKGSLCFKEAQVVVFLTDNETTEQIAAAEGSARSTDIGVGTSALAGLSGTGKHVIRIIT